MITTPPPFDKDEHTRKASSLASDVLYFMSSHRYGGDMNVAISALYVATESLTVTCIKEHPAIKYNMILSLNASWDHLVNKIDKIPT